MCGVIGIVGNEPVALNTILGLYDLQHRGEQGAGIVICNNDEFQEHKGEGLVAKVFSKENIGEKFKTSGRSAVGHVLYSTIGNNEKKEQPKTIQPLIGSFHAQPFAIALNGNLIGLEQLRKEAEAGGHTFQFESSDTEVIVGLLSVSKEKNFLDALVRILPKLKGGFALCILFKDRIIGVRDAKGIRPLCLGQDDSSFILASEESAFHTMKAGSVREINPGELIVLGENGIEKSFIWADKPKLKFCIFEYIYFARPDSRFCGQRVWSYRKNAGRGVAIEASSSGISIIGADIICAVPESGEIYNYGVAEALNIPVDKGIFRNRYQSPRTFMAPRHIDRRASQRKKLYVLRDVVYGRNIVITEDSILRASVSPVVVAMLREKGAIEVHLMVGSAPIRYPCFLGIDTPTRQELIASGLKEDEIRKKIGADSLSYLSIEGMIEASSLPRKNLCLGCFTGEYPVEPPANLGIS